MKWLKDFIYRFDTVKFDPIEDKGVLAVFIIIGLIIFLAFILPKILKYLRR